MPILNKLRPMLATHLPFMSSEESTYRTVSMYLTAQYFLHKSGQPADWELKHLLDLLKECRATNSGYCGRLRSLGIGDAALNALALLNVQGELTQPVARNRRSRALEAHLCRALRRRRRAK